MQKAPVLKGSGLAPIDDEAKNVHVFGKNLEERVVACEEDETTSKNEVPEESRDDDVETIKKRKFETITGEEDEETAFQGDFKLFSWDISTSNWIEKGRGQLKLNDKLETDGRKSRLIMRTGGTYRIILNVAIQHPTFRVIANTKTNIRFTDSQNVWAASGSNAMQLGDLIDQRLKIDAIKQEVDLKGQKTEPQDDKVEDRNNRVEDQKDEVDGQNEKVEDQSKEAEKQDEKVSEKSNDTNDNCDRVDSSSRKEEEDQDNKSEDQDKEKEDQPEEIDDQSKKIDSPTRKAEDQSDKAEDQGDKVEEENEASTSEEVQDESTKNVSRSDHVDDRDCEQHEAKKRRAE